MNRITKQAILGLVLILVYVAASFGPKETKLAETIDKHHPPLI